MYIHVYAHTSIHFKMDKRSVNGLRIFDIPCDMHVQRVFVSFTHCTVCLLVA